MAARRKEGTPTSPVNKKAPGDVSAPGDVETLKKRIEQLEAENEGLSTENLLLKERVSELEKEVTLDDLTGLRRRKNFIYEAERLLVQVIKSRLRGSREKAEQRHGTEPSPEQPNVFTIAMLDIDDFKKINDAYGHAGGDEVLRTVADVIRTTLRDETDLVGRWGGEEIIIAFRHHPGKGIVVAERIRRAIEDISITVGKSRVPVTASIGFSDWQEGDTFQNVVDHADEAMYKAKGAGKNRVWPYKGIEGIEAPLQPPGARNVKEWQAAETLEISPEQIEEERQKQRVDLQVPPPPQNEESRTDFAKRRALMYLERGDLPGAIDSMVSDLGKDDSRPSAQKSMIASTGMILKRKPDLSEKDVRDFIEGFA